MKVIFIKELKDEARGRTIYRKKLKFKIFQRLKAYSKIQLKNKILELKKAKKREAAHKAQTALDFRIFMLKVKMLDTLKKHYTVSRAEKEKLSKMTEMEIKLLRFKNKIEEVKVEVDQEEIQKQREIEFQKVLEANKNPYLSEDNDIFAKYDKEFNDLESQVSGSLRNHPNNSNSSGQKNAHKPPK